MGWVETRAIHGHPCRLMAGAESPGENSRSCMVRRWDFLVLPNNAAKRELGVSLVRPLAFVEEQGRCARERQWSVRKGRARRLPPRLPRGRLRTVTRPADKQYSILIERMSVTSAQQAHAQETCFHISDPEKHLDLALVSVA
jgi:hypothetical protein